MFKMTKEGLLKKMSDCKDLGYVFTIIESVPTLVYPGHGVRGAVWKVDIIAEMVLPETWVAELQFRGGDWYFAKSFIIYRKETFQLSLFTFWHNELLRLIKMFSWEGCTIITC